jgi:hypothetical protein
MGRSSAKDSVSPSPQHKRRASQARTVVGIRVRTLPERGCQGGGEPVAALSGHLLEFASYFGVMIKEPAESCYRMRMRYPS